MRILKYNVWRRQTETYMQELASDVLFARPTFWRGFCRVGDLFGQFDIYNVSASQAEADNLALASDWYMLGVDAQTALQEFNHDMREKNKELSLK